MEQAGERELLARAGLSPWIRPESMEAMELEVVFLEAKASVQEVAKEFFMQ